MRLRLIVTAVVIVLLAACSSGSGSATSRTSSTSRTSTTEPGTRVATRPSSGCTATPPVTAGEAKITTTSGGTERWYYRHVPAGATDARPVPVVVDLHGYLEGATIHTQMSRLGEYGDAHGFVTITPQGSGVVPQWNTGPTSADVRFVGDLLDEVERTLCVDQRRIYVTGLSNGAFMTSALACAYADRVAAVAPVAGIQSVDRCNRARPVPVVAFHGTADGFVAFDGGLGPRALDLPSPDGSGKTLRDTPGIAKATKGPSVPEITATWAKRNGCDPKPTEQVVANDVTLVRYSCPKGADVQLNRVSGGGHTWPGSEFSKGIEKVVGPTTSSISADDVMWKFFQEHPLT